MRAIPTVGWHAGFFVALTTAALAALLAPALTYGETIHFLVAERPEFAVHGDSYVLPLSDPTAIAHARGLIDSTPELSSIAVAKIAPGADGINRDHLADGAPAWSWHVTEFVGFADLTAEILDGWPTFVESDVPGWIANTDATIGFWTYTVVAELPAIPEPSTATMLALATVSLVAGRGRFKRSVANRSGVQKPMQYR